MRIHLRFLPSALLAISGLTGCTMANNAPNSVQALRISGHIYGGALPINMAKVYLYAANTVGNAGPGIAASTTNASISLLQSAANTLQDANGNYYTLTDSGGNFALGGDFAPCTPGQQLYLYASGGDSGIGNNSASGMMAALGACLSDYSNTHVVLNEMSTIAAGYALAGYATDATHIADDEGVMGNVNASYAQTGMANAFANAGNLVTLATGTPLSTTPGGNGTVPMATLNTLANLLAGCVQSSGAGSIPCSDLFSFTGTPGSADTATAAILLAQNPVGAPGTSITPTHLFNEIATNAAFNPSLSSAPNDFTVAISYTGTQGASAGLAIDAVGNVWVAGNSGNGLAEFSGSGAAYTNSFYPLPTAMSLPVGVAVGSAGDIWVADNGTNRLTRFVGSGSSYTGTDFSGSGLNQPSGIAVDASGNVWAANLNGSAISEFAPSGGTYAPVAPNAGGGLSSPNFIAIDASDNLWVANYTSSSLSEFSPATGYTGTSYPMTSMALQIGVAIDGTGNVWVDSYYGDELDVFTPSPASGGGVTYTSTAFTGGGLSSPIIMGIDGSGRVWVPNSIGNSISAFTNAGVALSPAGTGYTGTVGMTGGAYGPLNNPEEVAIDGSGNAWVSNFNNNLTVQFVGAATPVVTPLVRGVSTGTLGTRP